MNLIVDIHTRLYFPQNSINLIVDVYDADAEPNNDDELIDTLTFTFNSSTPVSSQFLPILQSSDRQVGTLNTSYRITCFTGYCGSDCEIVCNDIPRNNCKCKHFKLNLIKRSF